MSEEPFGFLRADQDAKTDNRIKAFRIRIAREIMHAGSHARVLPLNSRDHLLADVNHVMIDVGRQQALQFTRLEGIEFNPGYAAEYTIESADQRSPATCQPGELITLIRRRIIRGKEFGGGTRANL